MKAESINPCTEDLLARYDFWTNAALKSQVEKSHEQFLTWRGTSFTERSDLLGKLADVLTERKKEYAKLMTLEMGKPILQSRAEVEKCALVCRYYAEHGREFLKARNVFEDSKEEGLVVFEPLGVILGIMPWNFPFWQVFRFAVPTIMAGNTVLLKHAPNVTGSALKIEEAFLAAGFPEHVLKVVVATHDQIATVLEHPAVQGVSLTGSTRAGSQVASHAAKQIKKAVLELGGSDAYLVLEDADIDHAARVCSESRLINSGQSCIAAKRFIVVESVREQFETKMIANMTKRKVGDPMMDATDIGPLARGDLRDSLQRQVSASLEAGAKVLCGGSIPGGPGYFYPPTVLTNVGPGMPAFDEEIFGPVAAVVAARDEKDAVRLANMNQYGLGAAIFTRDRERGLRLAHYELEAGACFINQYVRSDPRLPFGGIKKSGYGRELARAGIMEFVNIKSVLFSSI